MSTEIKNLRELQDKIATSSSKKFFIVGHNEPDFDSIASSIGLHTLCKHLGKEAYIIVNDPEVSLEPGVKKIKDSNIIAHNIISLEGYKLVKEPATTLIVTDTNKSDLISVGNMLDDFNEIIIVDHHQPGEKTIPNATTYIDQSVSSASEVISQLLINAKVTCDPNVYTYLLAGIILDTGRFKKNTTPRTHDIARKLMHKGADTDYVNELFLADFNTDRVINDLIFNGTLFQAYEYNLVDSHNVSFTLNRDKPRTIYRKEMIAKAADRMLKYRVDAAIVMGYVDETVIGVSARSKGIIDVGKIMAHIGGGGNSQNAGARVEGMSIVDLEDILTKSINYGVEVDGEMAPPEEGKVIIEPKIKVKM